MGRLVFSALPLNDSALPTIFSRLDFDQKLLLDRYELEKHFKMMYSKDPVFEGESIYFIGPEIT